MRKRRLWVPLVLVLLLSVPATAATFTTGGPSTTNNDDSCDIALLPAATLLLPYFEVAADGSETTLFTITNTTQLPQIAHVTLWTDHGYPVVDFNLWLTGYDVQSINLFDIIFRGILAPANGTGEESSPVGDLSQSTNPLHLASRNCSDMPGPLPPFYVSRMQSAFRLGRVTQIGNTPGCDSVGNPHDNAVGYATIDVTSHCTVTLPTDPLYYQGELLFDNVLMGDYQQVASSNKYAQASPMVHIRAVPEGGNVASRTDDSAFTVNLPRTFYSRYQNGGKRDARQPLPSRFVPRWIHQPGGMSTSFKIWREGRTTGTTQCGDYPLHGGMIPLTEILMFDEEENPYGVASSIGFPPLIFEITLPSTSRHSTQHTGIFPIAPTDAVAGWFYLNLDSVENDGVASQNWVVASMAAGGRFSVDTDATALGNGCSPEIGPSEFYGGDDVIGPSPNRQP